MMQLWVGSWVTPGWGLVTQKDQVMIQKLGIFNLNPHFQRKKGEMEVIIDQGLHEETSIKFPIVGHSELPGWLNTSAPRIHPDSRKTRLTTQTFPDLFLCITSSGCSSVSFIISLQKLISLSVSLSSAGFFSKLVRPRSLWNFWPTAGWLETQASKCVWGRWGGLLRLRHYLWYLTSYQVDRLRCLLGCCCRELLV